MQYREFMSLTDEEIRQIVSDIFCPKKITCIKRNKTYGFITCKIYTGWQGDTSIGEPEEIVIADELTMRNPFEHSPGLGVDFSLTREDILKYKQFCFAKGICPWLKDNPYLTEN